MKKRLKRRIALDVFINKRVLWMMDESRAESSPNNWNRIDNLFRHMIDLCGQEGFQHEIVDPNPCIYNIVSQLRDMRYDSFIDLTGWLTPIFSIVLPDAKAIKDFGLSRIRRVDDPNIPTTGYLKKCGSERENELKQSLKDKKVLIVDDVSFTGGTGLLTEKIIDLTNPDHAYLILNTGDLGTRKGAASILEGRNVYAGFTIHTPDDDGWHLRDLYQHPNLREAFFKSLELQELMIEKGENSKEVEEAIKNEEALYLLFPDLLKSAEVNVAIENSILVSANGPVVENSYHSKNPFLWASKYFAEHINREKLFKNKEQIYEVLVEIKNLCPGYAKVQEEVDAYFKSMIRR